MQLNFFAKTIQWFLSNKKDPMKNLRSVALPIESYIFFKTRYPIQRPPIKNIYILKDQLKMLNKLF